MIEVKREIRLLVLLLVILFIAFVWYIIAGAPRQNVSPSTGQQTTAATTPPPFTPEIAAQLAKSHGFQMLISYTDRGFEPTSASIKKGDTVRFTNNSSHTLWIAAAPQGDKVLYPGKSDCGGSALDTCKALKPLEFWEFTFTQSGTWGYQNNLNKDDIAVINVR